MTRQQVRRRGYLEEFVRLWSENDAVRKILVSLYTPPVGEVAEERLTPADRSTVVADLLHLRERFPKLRMPRAMIEVYATPPASPDECGCSQMTTCISADFRTRISPCQFGGDPDYANCGCAASAGLAAIGRHQLPLGVRVDSIFKASLRVGVTVNRLRPVSSA